MEPHLELPAAPVRLSRHLTRQRQLVLEILKETPGHPDAGMIYLEAKKRDERIGLATVYRSLDFLKNEGLVEENSFGEDHGHFETTQGPHHYHFTCVDCGKVIELKGAEMDRIVQTLSDLRPVQVTEINIHLRGCCPDCQKNKPQHAVSG